MPRSLAAFYDDLLATHPPALAVELLGTAIVQTLFFWVPSLFFLLLDVLLPTRLSSRLKSQPMRSPPTRRDLLHCVRTVALNQLLAYLLQTALHLLFLAFLGRRPYALAPVAASFSFRRHLQETLFFLLPCCETLFYFLHRLLHSPRLYGRVHRIHHSYTAPVAPAAQYAHPLEHVLTYYVPVFLPAALLGTHVLTLWAWVGLVCFESCVLHSGWEMGEVQRRHDRHHERGGGGYGTFWVLDWVCGTEISEEKKWRRGGQKNGGQKNGGQKNGGQKNGRQKQMHVGKRERGDRVESRESAPWPLDVPLCIPREGTSPARVGPQRIKSYT